MEADEVAQNRSTLVYLAEYLFRLMIEQAGEMDLTVSQLHAISLLGSTSRSTGEMAAGLRISPPAVTQLTDRLLGKGLIERRSLAGDRRVVHVALTESGMTVLSKFRERLSSVLEAAVAVLPDTAERKAAIGSLASIARELPGSVPLSAPEQTSALARSIVDSRRGARSEEKTRAAPDTGDASNNSVQWRAGHTGRKVKIEWD